MEITVCLNSIIDLLGPYELKVYLVLLNLCDKEGALQISSKELSKKCKMSLSKFKEVKNTLSSFYQKDLPLISITKTYQDGASWIDIIKINHKI